MRVLAITTLTIICAVLTHAQKFQFREEYPFINGSDKGRVVLEMEERSPVRDQIYPAQYTFHVTNGSYAVYNWQFISLLPLSGQLAVYNDKKEYVGDLLHWNGGSQRTVTDSDWTFLYGGAHVGHTLGVRFGRMSRELPAGTYYIQLILYKAFISPNPFRMIGEPPNFYTTFDKDELCRSNVIKVEVIDP
jgi:hypothetical protein